MSILNAIKGWKTVSGLASIIIALLFRDGTIGDHGAVSQVFEYILTLLGGGLSIGGVVSKVKTQAAQKAAEIKREKESEAVSNAMIDMFPSLLADLTKPTADEIAKARAKAEKDMKGYVPNDAVEATNNAKE